MAVLRAGGHRIHHESALRPPLPAERDSALKPDAVPIIERYQDLAAAIHRTAVAPRGDRFLWGCTCGKFNLTPQGSLAKAQLIAAQHVLEEAEAMFLLLEGHPIVPITEE
jgi:hypothetical protein